MIILGADKHGFNAIQFVIKYLENKNIEYINLGVKNEFEDEKLEILIPKVVNKVLENDESFGILSCGTGVGMEIGANKFSGIRACLANNEKVASYARVYDKCNILCLVGWETDENNINLILDSWFNSKYDGNESRLKMFEEFDKWH